MSMGVIRYYNQLQVDGTAQIQVLGSEMPVIPVFTASAAMQVEFGEKTYDLAAGNNKIYDIVLMNQTTLDRVLLTFTGTGTVSIGYKTGRL